MNLEKRFINAAALIAGAILLCAGSAMNAEAADTTTAAETQPAASSETQAVSTTAATTTAAVTDEHGNAVTTTAAEVEIEWFKADLDEYDESLSLISYEVSPESAKDGKSGRKKNKKPTPVELDVTGGYVGDIPWFESEPVIEENPGQFAIVTYGWGHGVGMSQNGANFYATYSGWTYQDILFHYYPDTYLMNTGLAEEEEITVAGVSGDVLSMVSQIVYNEVGGSMSYEAIKAQAVAVYTYCKYNGNNGSDLRCKPNPPQVVVDAVSEVLGQALYYNDDYALTMFSASSGGITANCYEVFWADLPYLRSVSSDYDAAFDPHYGTVTYIDDFQLRNMLQSAFRIKLSDDPYNWLKPTYSDQTGYVTYINIDDQITVRGYEFKLAMGLKSSKFNVFYTPRPEGEEIPRGTSTPRVVNPDYERTPAVIYSNSQPTDIGSPTYPPIDEPTDTPNDEPREEPSTNDEPTEYQEPTEHIEPTYDFPEWAETPTWDVPEDYDPEHNLSN